MKSSYGEYHLEYHHSAFSIFIIATEVLYREKDNCKLPQHYHFCIEICQRQSGVNKFKLIRVQVSVKS